MPRIFPFLFIVLLGCSKHSEDKQGSVSPKHRESPPSIVASSGPIPVQLQESEAKFLDSLFDLGLFDPIRMRATRVFGRMRLRNCFGKVDEKEVSAWLVPPMAGKLERIVLDNLQEVDPPLVLSKREFNAQDVAAMASNPSRQFYMSPGGVFRAPVVQNLVWAAWLHRVGRDNDAASILQRASIKPIPDDLGSMFRDELGWQLFDQAINAFLVGEDEAARDSLTRLVTFQSPYIKNGTILLQDLERRQQIDKVSRSSSSDLTLSPLQRQLGRLVAQLDQINVPQTGSPGEIEIERDPLFVDLCAMGEQAVPALIECVRQDRRLTRCVGFWRDYDRSRKFVSVCEVAYGAIQSILKTTFRDSIQGVLELGFEDDEARSRVVSLLCEYWERHKKTPFVRRMMAILVDEKASPLAWQEAADNLAHLGQRRSFSMTRWLPAEPPIVPAIREELTSIEHPTAAEAVLTAFDRHLVAFARFGKQVSFYGLDRLEDTYIQALSEIGDARIIPILEQRVKAAGTLRIRRKLALCVHVLGRSEAINTLAKEFESGKLTLPPNDQPEIPGNMKGSLQPGNTELRGLVESFAKAGTPSCESALSSLTRRNHPQFLIALERLKFWPPTHNEDRAWFLHPYCLRILRAELENKNTDGSRISVERGYVVWRLGSTSRETTIPEVIADSDARNESEFGRHCDAVAMQLNSIVLGLPVYHPLLKSPDLRLAEIVAAMDRYLGNYRLLTADEIRSLGLDQWQPYYIPDIRLGMRKATAQDVNSGKALFSINGESVPANVRLPAFAQIKSTGHPVLILQAETVPDRKVMYGTICPDAIRVFGSEQLTDPVPVTGLLR